MSKKNKDSDTPKEAPPHPFSHTEVKAPHGGKQAVLDMFQHLDEEHRTRLISEIKGKDPALAQEILDSLFTFEDFIHLDAKALVLIYRSVSETTFALALRGASENLKKTFFHALPARASENLKDLVSSMGPQVKKAIDEAQKEVLEVAKKLESEGKLLLKK